MYAIRSYYGFGLLLLLLTAQWATREFSRPSRVLRLEARGETRNHDRPNPLARHAASYRLNRLRGRAAVRPVNVDVV